MTADRMAPAPDAARPDVVVLDDSLTVRMDLRDALEAGGFGVRACATAEAFWPLVAAAVPDLVLLDVVLPDGDGLAILDRLKHEAATRDVPVMLLSTEAEVADRLRGLACGADDYAGKPYDRAALVERARALIAARREPGARTVPLVLVIDDSATYREAMKAALAGAGYAVALAATGEDGLRAAAGARPDAMIVDNGLPGIDGATVIRRLRMEPALRRTPVMLLTAAETREVELGALEAGADAFMRKSEDVGEVLARLAAIMRAAHAPDAIAPATGRAAQRLVAMVDRHGALGDLGERLAAEGYDLVHALDAPAALALAAVQPVDAVLVDEAGIGPGTLALVRALKDGAGFGEVPLVVLGGRVEPGAAIAALDAGADDYLDRGRDAEVVLGRLRALLRRRHIEDENRRIQDTIVRKEVEIAEARAARELAETRAALLAENERLQAEKIEALKQADYMKDKFLSILSHELRTPINAIVGFGSLLGEPESGPLTEEQQLYLKKMLVGADNLLALVNELLDMSRIQAGKFKVELEPSMIQLVVADALAMLASLAEPKGIALEDAVPRDLPAVLADPRRLGQVVTNLVSNAIKFSPPQGVVRIEARADGERVVCEVHDHGPGIDPADLPKLFQPFSQLDTPQTRQAVGTGLGLSIVKAIVEAHGGEIGAKSEPGRGSVFWFAVPVAKEAGDWA